MPAYRQGLPPNRVLRLRRPNTSAQNLRPGPLPLERVVIDEVTLDPEGGHQRKFTRGVAWSVCAVTTLMPRRGLREILRLDRADGEARELALRLEGRAYEVSEATPTRTWNERGMRSRRAALLRKVLSVHRARRLRVRQPGYLSSELITAETNG